MRLLEFPGAVEVLQKITLAPSCTCRDGVAVESNSPVVPGDSWLKPSRPPKVKLFVGAWKFVWLKTLKASTLSWRLNDSEMRERRIFLMRERSILTKRGPMS